MTRDKDSRRKRLEKKAKDKERPRRTKRPKPYERLKEDECLMRGV
jgi:hypothetical protein